MSNEQISVEVEESSSAEETVMMQLAEQQCKLEEDLKALAAEKVKIDKDKASVEQARAAAEKVAATAEQSRTSAAQERELLKQEKEQAKQEKTQMQAEKVKFEQEKRALEAMKKTALDRDRTLTERETNAENGFLVQNEKTLVLLKTQIAQLQGEIVKQKGVIASTLKESDKVKAAKEAELDKWVEDYRQSKLQQVDNEISSIQKGAIAQNELLKKAYEENVKFRERDFERISKEFDKRLEELHTARQDQMNVKQSHEEWKAELEAKQFEIRMDRKLLDEQMAVMNDRIHVQVEERVKEVSARLRDKERAEAEWIRKLSVLQQELDTYKQADLAAGGRSKDDLLHQIARLQQDIRTLKQELDSRPDANVIAELEEKSRNYEELRQQNRELVDIKVEFESQKHTWLMSVSDLQQQREMREMEEKRREALNAQVQKYEEDVKRLKSQFDQPQAVEERVRVIELPYFKRDDRMRETLSEVEWLEEIYTKSQGSGLLFNKRLLYSFHTALKTSDWSPLTILAGVSGTGKSELPKLYSRFGGLYFLPLAVQPDWDSPQSLFGYFNSIDNKYNATSLLRAMTQFQNIRKEGSQIGNLSDSMLLVLLDEMNLAHVELYFSDLLSKLEMRRGDHKGQNIEIDTGADHDKYHVQLSRNVLWAGTMNEDETTKSLSDKVLDRGNMINFPRPVRFERRQQLELADASPMLRRETWNQWLNNKFVFKKELENYKLGLEAVNERLEHVGRALGHRVWQAIENYVANHPLVIQAAEIGDEKEISRCLESAFEEAVVHKVMPKLRGIDTTDGNSRTKSLEPIGEILSEIAPGLVTDYQIAKDPNFGFFMWKSAKYLEHRHAEQ